MAERGALRSFHPRGRHTVYVVGGVFDRTGPELIFVQYMTAILPCRRDRLAFLHLTRRRALSTLRAD
jgi:hypothetical protein